MKKFFAIIAAVTAIAAPAQANYPTRDFNVAVSTCDIQGGAMEDIERLKRQGKTFQEIYEWIYSTPGDAALNTLYIENLNQHYKTNLSFMELDEVKAFFFTQCLIVLMNEPEGQPA